MQAATNPASAIPDVSRETFISVTSKPTMTPAASRHMAARPVAPISTTHCEPLRALFQPFTMTKIDAAKPLVITPCKIRRRVSLTAFMALCEGECMKTTLDLPESLMRRVRLRAVHRGQKLKVAVAQLLELGMAAEGDVAAAPKAPVPVRLKGRGPVTLDDIEDANRVGRD